LRRSGLLRVQVVRVMYYTHRALGALSAAATAEDPRHLIEVASSDALRLRRDDASWSKALGRLMEAAVTHHRGDSQGAAAALHPLIGEFEALSMRGFAAATRHRLGELIG